MGSVLCGQQETKVPPMSMVYGFTGFTNMPWAPSLSLSSTMYLIRSGNLLSLGSSETRSNVFVDVSVHLIVLDADDLCR